MGNGSFQVPAQICGQHLAQASELSLKALLILLCEGGQDSEKLAQRLNCESKELTAALDYWVDCGLYSRRGGVLTLDSAPAAAIAAPSVSESPLISSAEAAQRLKADDSLKFFIEQVGQCFGRLLSQGEVTHLISIIDYSGLGLDVMLMLVQYCRQADKCTLAYIKKVAMDWSARGITTHRLADEQIRLIGRQNDAAALVRAAFEIGDRGLISKEKEFAAQWVIEMGFDREMITEAFTRCVMQTGKCDFRYIDKILGSWYAQGYKTVAEIPSQDKKKIRKNDTAADDDVFLSNALKKKKI